MALLAGIGDLPIFSPDREGGRTPDAVKQMAREVELADGLVFSSPEYAHGVPGGLKNALDWLVSRGEIPDKPVAIFHASHRGDIGLAALREIFRAIKVDVVEGAFLRIPLLGESPESVASIVAEAAHTERIRSALKILVEHISIRKHA